MADHASSAVAAPQTHGAHGHDEHGHDDLMLVGHDGQLYPAHLQHHFVSAEQQFSASKLGMWIFLATEILLFGGLFVAYAIFRAWYPELFAEASTQLDTVMGAINTLVLLASSLTVAWAIRGAQTDNRKVLFWNLVVTVVLAGCFMGIKYQEYTHKFSLGIYPGTYFVLEPGTTTVSGELVEPLTPAVEGGAEGAAGEQAAEGAHAAEGEHGAHAREGAIFSDPRAGLFFSLYFVMTGIHAIHVIIGMIAISILAWRARKGRYSSVYYTPVENVGLYWHVVDIIWIFLFPLMYLI